MPKASFYLATQVNDVGIWIVERQQDPIAGVHLMKGYWLLHVFLETKNARDVTEERKS